MGKLAANPNGFSHGTSADEIMKKIGNELIKGKYIVITGANGGLGFESARCLAANGAIVTLCARNEKNGIDAVNKIKASCPSAEVTYEQLDLSNLKSVKAFVDRYTSSKKPLHILLNNAGVMACPRTLTADGIEQQMGVNHIGHFYLTTNLLPILESSGTATAPSRVVCVSSMANNIFAPRPHGINITDFNLEKSYNSWVRYGESKLANILFAKELNDRMKAQKKPIVAVSLHPGVITDTDLMRFTSGFRSYWELVCGLFGGGGISSINSTRKNIPQGAATQVMLCATPDIEGGQYYADCGVHIYSAEGALHPRANDKQLMQQLWEKSEEIISQVLAR